MVVVVAKTTAAQAKRQAMTSGEGEKGFLAKIRSINSMVVLRFMLDTQLVLLEV